jgi:hypothetical protein
MRNLAAGKTLWKKTDTLCISYSHLPYNIPTEYCLLTLDNNIKRDKILDQKKGISWFYKSLSYRLAYLRIAEGEIITFKAVAG